MNQIQYESDTEMKSENNFYLMIRRHQFNFSDYGPADVVFGKMEIKIKL